MKYLTMKNNFYLGYFTLFHHIQVQYEANIRHVRQNNNNGCWCQTGLSISKTADLLRFSQPSLVFTENGPKKRKYSVSGSCVDGNALLL